MEVFVSTLNQTTFLFGFIIIGFILVKLKVLSENASTVLSKLENTVFIPALVMGTFIENFTVERITATWEILIISLAIAVVVIPIAILISRLVTKDKYIQNIYTYGLSFSNFGFMGNAVVMSLFPDMFFEYLIFTLPLWILIYVWGVPALLISDSGKNQTFKERIKSFVNPMFIAMIIGMIIGLLNVTLPQWALSLIDTSSDCMSPVAMILTGVVVASNPLKSAFLNVRIYIVSIVRLIVFPLVFILVAPILNLSEIVFVCAVCSLAMPLGLNTIVIPSAYGKDTSVAAGMAVISHLFAVLTIPLIFSIM